MEWGGMNCISIAVMRISKSVLTVNVVDILFVSIFASIFSPVSTVFTLTLGSICILFSIPNEHTRRSAWPWEDRREWIFLSNICILFCSLSTLALSSSSLYPMSLFSRIIFIHPLRVSALFITSVSSSGDTCLYAVCTVRVRICFMPRRYSSVSLSVPRSMVSLYIHSRVSSAQDLHSTPGGLFHASTISLRALATR